MKCIASPGPHRSAFHSCISVQGVTYRLTQGVTKNIIPAIASTNALIAAVCSLEVLKLATMCSTGLNNYLMYEGPDECGMHPTEAVP